MAVKTATNYYSNAIVGTPQVGADVNVLETHSTPKFAVGIGFERQDGARFRYVQYGAATEAGLVVSSDLDESGLAVTGTNVIIQSASATAIAGETIKPCGKGSHYVEAYLTAGLNQFAGGYLCIAAQAAAREGRGGYVYRIRGNTAAASGGGQKCMLTLYEPLKYELTTECCFSIVPNAWVNVEPATDKGDSFIAGVACAAASANQYGWVCTRGVSVGLPELGGFTSGTNLVGSAVYLGTTTAGYVSSTLGLVTGTAGNWYATEIGSGIPCLGTIIHTGSNGTFTSIALNLF